MQLRLRCKSRIPANIYTNGQNIVVDGGYTCIYVNYLLCFGKGPVLTAGPFPVKEHFKLLEANFSGKGQGTKIGPFPLDLGLFGVQYLQYSLS